LAAQMFYWSIRPLTAQMCNNLIVYSTITNHQSLILAINFIGIDIVKNFAKFNL
jgi:hypothetical protein